MSNLAVNVCVNVKMPEFASPLRTAMEHIRNAISCCRTSYAVMSKDPPRTLRWASAISGLLLMLGGIVGVFTINPLAIIISLYNVGFGILIVLTELKTLPIIRTFQRRIDVYFHLLSSPRGKGGFYCFIGFLSFFAESGWSLSSICTLIVSCVGVIHLFACKRCGAVTDNEFINMDKTKQSYEMSGLKTSADDNEVSWAGLMKQVISDSPEVLGAGLGAASNPSVQSFAAAALGGGSSGSSGAGAHDVSAAHAGAPIASGMTGSIPGGDTGRIAAAV
jgi:hypothetical protein